MLSFQADQDKATLTATNAAQAKRIQELLAEIEMLKKRIAELENAQKAQDDTFKHRLADLQEVNMQYLYIHHIIYVLLEVSYCIISPYCTLITHTIIYLTFKHRLADLQEVNMQYLYPIIYPFTYYTPMPYPLSTHPPSRSPQVNDWLLKLAHSLDIPSQ